MNLGPWHLPLDLSEIARPLRRLVEAPEGVETVEFALVSIALFMFLLGVVEFGRAYWTQSELQYAAEAAARWCTINNGGPNSCDTSTGITGAQNYTASQLLGMSIPGNRLLNFQVTTPTPACGNQVKFDYRFTFIVTALLPQSAITLSTTACHQA